MSSQRPDTSFRVHRLTTGRVVVVLLMFAVAYGIVDALGRHRLGTALAGLLVLLGGCALGYVLGLRPAVVEDLTGIEVRNPLRTTVVPWQAVTDVDVTDVLRIHAGDVVVRCFAVPRRRPSVISRPRTNPSYGFPIPAAQPAADPDRTPGMSRADGLAARLRRMAEAYGVPSTPAPGTATVPRTAPGTVVAVDAVVGLVAAVGLAVAGILVAVL